MSYSDDYDKIFGRLDLEANVMVLYADRGEAVTRLDSSVHPIGSDVSARYEHSEGIILSRSDAKSLGIEIEK